MNLKDTMHEIAHQPTPGLLAEVCQMLMENKKWWLLPILMVLFLLGVLVFLSGSAVAPFVYTLF